MIFSFFTGINFARKLFSTKGSVRVRFAPSPTGYLHLGGLRTALYNYLFARANGGKFILRIEDTDRSRLVEGAVEQLENDLEWFHLTPDEGPKYGGPVGPYLQSERIDLYRQEAEHLISTGAAYYCFCTERRLDLLRRDAIRNRAVPKYDNHCRNLTTDEVKQKLSSGISKCVRFKLVPAEPFDDLIYGKTLHDVAEIEGDPIIVKSDGWPTYHLANVVDDNKMLISHVIRGVEWIQSTNKHLMIYKALGYEPPKFAHLPLILNKDGSKLSKRQSDLSIRSLKEKGILPNTLLNFVIQAGSGFIKKPDKNSTIENMISLFDIKSVSTNSSKLPLDRLEEFNRMELARQINNNCNIDNLINEAKEIILQSFSKSIDEINLELDDNHIKKVLIWSLPRITSLHDLVSDNMKFLWVKPVVEKSCTINSELLHELKRELSCLDFEEDHLKKFFKEYSNSHKIPFKDLMELMRKSVSGLKKGPGVAEMLSILGKDVSLKRMEYAIRTLPS